MQLDESHVSDKPKVLVVDDDETMLKVLTYQLIRKGYDTKTATSVTEAENLMAANMPDVIICDWVMPERDGIDFCKSLRAKPETNSVYFIMLTGRSSQSDKISALNQGVDDYLEKPVEPAELIARVNVGWRIVKLQQQLIDHQRTQTFREMAAGISHEINNPLTGLLGFLELSKKRLSRESVVKEDIDKVVSMIDRGYEQGRRISEIVKKLSNLRNYKVKNYSDEIRMIDIDVASQNVAAQKNSE
jgi:DNA-binding response OmpR family regulator